MEMIRRNKAAIPLLILFLFTWCTSLLLSQRLDVVSSAVSIRYEEGSGVSPSQISRIERYAKEDGSTSLPGATLWREKRGQTLSDGTFRSAGADVMEIYGDGSRLLPVTVLYGSLPSKGDGDGCAIDETVAQALWGTNDVVGKTLIYNDITYTVRGVFRGAKNLLVTQGDQDDKDLYAALSLQFDNGGSGMENAQKFISRNGLPTGQILDVPFLSWSVGFLAMLPGLVAAAYLVIRLLGQGYRLRRTPMLLLLFLVLAAVTVWGIGWAAGLPFPVPDSLIPSKWSDFDFWERLFKQNLESVAAAFRLPLTLRDTTVWLNVLGSLLTSLLAVGLVIPAIRKVRLESCFELVWATALCFAVVFLAALALLPAGGVTLNRSMWLLLPGIFGAEEWMKWYRRKVGADLRKEGVPDGKETTDKRADRP